MGWKNYLRVGFCLLFFLVLVIIGTNISAQQLAMAVDKEITPPFLYTTMDNGSIHLVILGESYQLSAIPIQNSYSLLKSSIQNSLVTVKFNLAPRVDYLRYHFSTGVEQLARDLTKIIP